jgi:FtsH-binding integral membrane protein
MKKILALAFTMIIVVQVSLAQTAYTEKRELSGFSKVSFAVSGEVRMR